jgi:hypothetical protein
LVAGFFAEASDAVAAKFFSPNDLVVALRHKAECDADHDGAVFESDPGCGFDLDTGVEELAMA